MSTNSLFLSGRCASDPVIPEGKKSLPLRIAVDRYDKDKRENVAEFYSVWCYQKTAEVVQEFVRKGDRVFIEGRVASMRREGAKYDETILVANRVEFMPRPKPEAEHPLDRGLAEERAEEQDEKGFKF